MSAMVKESPFSEFDSTYATIISLLPYPLVENKPGINPNEYIIKPKEKDSEFGITIIPNDAFYLVNPDPLSDAKDVKTIKVPVLAIELAQSIISDYINSLLAVDAPQSVPGLFCVKGNYVTEDSIKSKFSKDLKFYRDAQNNWFVKLVMIADDTWSKSRSPIGISDLERDACRALGYQRDWLNPLPSETQDKCPICKTIINLGALKCTACGFILNKKEYDRVMALVG